MFSVARELHIRRDTVGTLPRVSPVWTFDWQTGLLCWQSNYRRQ